MAGEFLPEQRSEEAATGWEELANMPAFEDDRFWGAAEKAVRETEASFEKIVSRNKGLVEKTRDGIAKLEEKLAGESDEWRAERYTQQIRDRERVLRVQEGWAEFARVPMVEDVEYRMRMRKDFAGQVREAVPDDLHPVFHGSNNLGIVRQIIQTRGLKTPDQRGESMTSFANQIDVTTKADIQTSCDFAEFNSYWMPYGAIFAFLPKLEEEAIVREDEIAGSSEVFGGVDGVDFKEQPERLLGIITTPENVSKLRGWCDEAGLDASKVLTHGDFIKSMQQLKNKES